MSEFSRLIPTEFVQFLLLDILVQNNKCCVFLGFFFFFSFFSPHIKINQCMIIVDKSECVGAL